MMTPPSRYIHGTAPEEHRRLGLMNDLLNESSLGELGLAGGERILDVGCGLAQLTRAMARSAGARGRVVGIEQSAEQIAEAGRQARAAREEGLVEIRQGDALAPPLHEDEWGTFDIVHARFVLEHVPDPHAVVCQMVHAARPGGRVILEDDDHEVMRLWPEPAGFDTLWRSYLRTYEGAGCDPFVGRRLVELLHAAGAPARRNRWLFYGGCAAHPFFPALVTNLAGVLRGARDAILAAGPLDAPAFDETIAALRAWGSRPEAALWYGRCWAEGVRPEGSQPV
jgi:SAM-dependent methyltransferase